MEEREIIDRLEEVVLNSARDIAYDIFRENGEMSYDWDSLEDWYELLY